MLPIPCSSEGPPAIIKNCRSAIHMSEEVCTRNGIQQHSTQYCNREDREAWRKPRGSRLREQPRSQQAMEREREPVEEGPEHEGPVARARSPRQHRGHQVSMVMSRAVQIPSQRHVQVVAARTTGDVASAARSPKGPREIGRAKFSGQLEREQPVRAESYVTIPGKCSRSGRRKARVASQINAPARCRSENTLSTNGDSCRRNGTFFCEPTRHEKDDSRRRSAAEAPRRSCGWKSAAARWGRQCRGKKLMNRAKSSLERVAGATPGRRRSCSHPFEVKNEIPNGSAMLGALPAEAAHRAAGRSRRAASPRGKVGVLEECQEAKIDDDARRPAASAACAVSVVSSRPSGRRCSRPHRPR